MLTFAAITPHPPLLIPSIGKENLKRIEKTTSAMDVLEKNIYESGVETLLVISPHGEIIKDTFSVNLNPEYEISLEEFGDFGTNLKYKTDTNLAYRIKELAEKQDIPLILSSDQVLDHGTAIPLTHLTKRLKDVKILPISYSLLDLKAHFNFGDFLKEVILNDDKKIGVIASGDLSHCLTENAPAGYSPKGKEFDEKVLELLTNKNTAGILSIDQDLVNEAHECGLRSFVILLGLLERINYSPEVLSYESPFGVGYLVLNFKLN